MDKILRRCRLMNWNVTAEKVYGDLWDYCWSLFLVITGMVLMEVNHVSPSNQNRFRVIGLTTVIALFGYLMPLMAANRVMRDHPDWVKFRDSSENSLADGLACQELCVIGRVYDVVVGRILLRHLNHKSSRQIWRDQQDNIQVNNVIDVPAIGGAYSDSQD